MNLPPNRRGERRWAGKRLPRGAHLKVAPLHSDASYSGIAMAIRSAAPSSATACALNCCRKSSLLWTTAWAAIWPIHCDSAIDIGDWLPWPGAAVAARLPEATRPWARGISLTALTNAATREAPGSSMSRAKVSHMLQASCPTIARCAASGGSAKVAKGECKIKIVARQILSVSRAGPREATFNARKRKNASSGARLRLACSAPRQRRAIFSFGNTTDIHCPARYRLPIGY